MTGTIAYEVASGLGIQTKAFVDHGIIDKVFVTPHSTYPREHWYTKEQTVNSTEELLDTCDKLIFMETPFHWDIIPKARERGIKTILLVMYECTPYPMPYTPDVLVGGSLAETQLYSNCKHINVPVEMEWKQRTKARVFIHNSGHGGLLNRNSTPEVLEAMKYVRSPIKLIVRTQNGNYTSNDPRVEIVRGSIPYEDLWKEGDVLLFPEKFGGSFLPMQEALASGMAVMATDRFPTNTWLPRELLIKPDGYEKKKIGSEFESAIINPKTIASKIDGWYNEDISRFSLAGKKWAGENSWEKLKQKYCEL
jgi:hypothetical protein